jgi:tRNA (Thr-GGU) A37 N-methylase
MADRNAFIATAVSNGAVTTAIRLHPIGWVLSTRSAQPPNPIGLHEVEVLGVSAPRVEVRDLEAVHGTPVLDLKPVLGPSDQR